MLPWSPLGRGVLTGKYRHGTPRRLPGRLAALRRVRRAATSAPRRAGIVEAVCTAADGLGVSPLEVALAWVRDRPGVVAPIVGARNGGAAAGRPAGRGADSAGRDREALDDVSAPYRRLPRDRGEPTLNAVVELLTAASRAGHTVLPPDVVLRTCPQDAVDDALTSGSVVEVEWHGAAALALVDVAESEELLADGLVGLAEENRLAVVVGPDPEARRRTLAMALGSGVPSVAVDDAHLAGLDDVLSAVEDLPEDAVLALSLDNALPLGPVLGAVALDVAASGTCPVLQADPPPARTALARARRDVAAGRWFATSPEDRSVVDVAVGSPDEALVRVVQLVTASIPRAFAATGDDVVVLLAAGTLDPDAVRRSPRRRYARRGVERALDDAGADVGRPAGARVAHGRRRTPCPAVADQHACPALRRAGRRHGARLGRPRLDAHSAGRLAHGHHRPSPPHPARRPAPHLTAGRPAGHALGCARDGGSGRRTLCAFAIGGPVHTRRRVRKVDRWVRCGAGRRAGCGGGGRSWP